MTGLQVRPTRRQHTKLVESPSCAAPTRISCVSATATGNSLWSRRGKTPTRRQEQSTRASLHQPGRMSASSYSRLCEALDAQEDAVQRRVARAFSVEGQVKSFPSLSTCLESNGYLSQGNPHDLIDKLENDVFRNQPKAPLLVLARAHRDLQAGTKRQGEDISGSGGSSTGARKCPKGAKTKEDSPAGDDPDAWAHHITHSPLLIALTGFKE